MTALYLDRLCPRMTRHAARAVLRAPRHAAARGAASPPAPPLRDHIDDAFAAGLDDAVTRLGPPAAVVSAWRAHISAARARTRRRAALLALTVATTGALGVAQHASGHRAPRGGCHADAAHAVV